LTLIFVDGGIPPSRAAGKKPFLNSGFGEDVPYGNAC